MPVEAVLLLHAAKGRAALWSNWFGLATAFTCRASRPPCPRPHPLGGGVGHQQAQRLPRNPLAPALLLRNHHLRAARRQWSPGVPVGGGVAAPRSRRAAPTSLGPIWCARAGRAALGMPGGRRAACLDLLVIQPWKKGPLFYFRPHTIHRPATTHHDLYSIGVIMIIPEQVDVPCHSCRPVTVCAGESPVLPRGEWHSASAQPVSWLLGAASPWNRPLQASLGRQTLPLPTQINTRTHLRRAAPCQACQVDHGPAR